MIKDISEFRLQQLAKSDSSGKVAVVFTTVACDAEMLYEGLEFQLPYTDIHQLKAWSLDA